MKYPTLALILLLFTCGCATHHSAPAAKGIRDKQDELEVVCDELRVTALQLERMQSELSTNGVYSVADQARDLDYSISTVLQARNKLQAKYWRLVNKYHYDWQGSL